MSNFCIKCGSFCEDEHPMDSFGTKLWCVLCNHYTKTIKILWDFPDSSLIIIADYTKTDKKATYNLHSEELITQKHHFSRRWI